MRAIWHCEIFDTTPAVVPLLLTVAIASADWPVYASLFAVDWPFRMTAGPGGWSSWPPCVVSNISQCQIALICAIARARSRKVSCAVAVLGMG